MKNEITRESLQRDADRRLKDRQKLAASYRYSAEALERDTASWNHREAISLLRAEAERWERA